MRKILSKVIPPTPMILPFFNHLHAAFFCLYRLYIQWNDIRLCDRQISFLRCLQGELQYAAHGQHWKFLYQLEVFCILQNIKDQRKQSIASRTGRLVYKDRISKLTSSWSAFRTISSNLSEMDFEDVLMQHSLTTESHSAVCFAML